MAPLIGITCYPPNAGDRYELPSVYVSAVRRAGGIAVVLPPSAGAETPNPETPNPETPSPGTPNPGTPDRTERAVAAVLDRLDGLVFAGGGDIDPAVYGGSGHETIYALDPDRDDDELTMARLVLERGTPTLAICRGSQIFNVATGGTLHTHLPDLVRDAAVPTVLHRKEPEVLRGMPGPTPHRIDVADDALIADVMGATSVEPMSWHHQAIDRVGDGFRVVATAPDGTVEAIEHESHPWLAVVQWHPELTAGSDPTQQRLFDALVDRCR